MLWNVKHRPATLSSWKQRFFDRLINRSPAGRRIFFLWNVKK